MDAGEVERSLVHLARPGATNIALCGSPDGGAILSGEVPLGVLMAVVSCRRCREAALAEPKSDGPPPAEPALDWRGKYEHLAKAVELHGLALGVEGAETPEDVLRASDHVHVRQAAIIRDERQRRKAAERRVVRRPWCWFQVTSEESGPQLWVHVDAGGRAPKWSLNLTLAAPGSVATAVPAVEAVVRAQLDPPTPEAALAIAVEMAADEMVRAVDANAYRRERAPTLPHGLAELEWRMSELRAASMSSLVAGDKWAARRYARKSAVELGGLVLSFVVEACDGLGTVEP